MPGGYGRVQGCNIRLPLGLGWKKHFEARFLGKRKDAYFVDYLFRGCLFR